MMKEADARLTKEDITKMSREEVYELYKKKKKMCKTIAQEVNLITSDPEMLMLRERLWGNDFN